MTQFLSTAGKLAARINDGHRLALAPDYSGCAVNVILEVIRQQRRDLHLIGVPQIGLQADLLIGAGCVASIDAASITLGEFGQAPRFVDAFQCGSVRMLDSTCPVIHAGLQAAEKGIPFMPLRGILDSDLVRHRPDWLTLNNPFDETDDNDPILLVPAIVPDVALFHAPLADRDGNVWIGTRRELMLMAHAALQSVVSVEKIVDENLLGDARTAAGVIPSLYLSAIAEIPSGAQPSGLFGTYDADEAALAAYADAARTAEGFSAWISDRLHD